MRETQFIKQNKAKWAEFEQVLDGQTQDPDQLRDLFVHITDDLSYSRTFYPNRSVRVYLNGLAQRIFLKLYRSRRLPLRQLLTFWTDELPREIYDARRAFRLALGVFVLSFLIGVISCAMDPEFAQVVLGQDYVEMTRANIESGDPMAVYKQRGEFNMFLGITLNNLFVAFLAFTMGVFFGLGSLIILVSNGIMVGCFQYFFIEQDVFWESFLTIWIHGTLEISAIVMAAAAGITMGQGIAFPGTYTRLQAFQQSARRGAKIMLGITPVFIVAGFLEGYLTRHTQTPGLIRGMFIAICLLFILTYFVWYPWFRARLGLDTAPVQNRMAPTKPLALDFGRIKSAGEILSDIFALLRPYGAWAGLAAVAGAVVFTGLTALTSPVSAESLFPLHFENWAWHMYNFTLLYSLREGYWLVPVLSGAILYGLAVMSFRFIQQQQGAPPPGRSAYIRLFFGIGAVMACIGYTSFWTILLMLLAVPVALLFAYISFAEPGPPWQALARSFRLISGEIWRVLGLNLLVITLGAAMLSIMNTVVADLFFRLANWLFTAEQAVLDEWSIWLMVFLTSLVANLIWTFFFMGFALLYHTLREVHEAAQLGERLQSIGQARRIRGLERE
ncbi:MAG: stage II sporulation protein M [Lewinella sp.]|nr:stage II sporulation protein M [Lewinella sp.]